MSGICLHNVNTATQASRVYVLVCRRNRGLVRAASDDSTAHFNQLPGDLVFEVIDEAWNQRAQWNPVHDSTERPGDSDTHTLKICKLGTPAKQRSHTAVSTFLLRIR